MNESSESKAEPPVPPTKVIGIRRITGEEAERLRSEKQREAERSKNLRLLL